MNQYLIMSVYCNIDKNYVGWFVAEEIGDGLWEAKSITFGAREEAENFLKRHHEATEVKCS